MKSTQFFSSYLSLFALLNLALLSQCRFEALSNLCVDVVANKFELTEALFCGRKPQNLWLRELFLQLGLYHLLVISGFHINMMHRAVFKLPFPRYVQHVLGASLCVLLAIICQFSPPIFRAATFQFLCSFSNCLKLGWTPLKLQFSSTLFTLICHPTWYDSLSLQLSLAACFVLCLPMPRHKISHLLKCALIFVVSWLLLKPLGVSSPITILINAYFSPLALFILLVTSFFSIFLPPLGRYASFLLENLHAQLKHYLPVPQSQIDAEFVSPLAFWFSYVAATCFLNKLYSHFRRRVAS